MVEKTADTAGKEMRRCDIRRLHESLMRVNAIPIDHPSECRRVLQLCAPEGTLAAVDGKDGVEAFLHDFAGGGGWVVDV